MRRIVLLVIAITMALVTAVPAMAHDDADYWISDYESTWFYQDFEGYSESGSINQYTNISGSFADVNQSANTGNVQNQTGVIQYGN